MFCVKCGTELPDDSQFCRKCGTALGKVSSVTSTGAAAAPAQTKSKSGAWGIRIVGVLLILFLGYWWIHQNVPQNQSQSQSQVATAFQQLVSQPHTATIAGGSFTVEASHYSYYRFTVPQDATDIVVNGHFSVSGGSGNDIEVYLISENDFVNWQNNHQAKTYYNSHKVTQDDINVRLSNPGTYYLVFNNNFSLFSSKAVQASVTLHYNQ